MQQQPPIADYGLIGDMRTAALVSRYGRIDWCCLPRFDSGSLFAAILDPERGGNWSIQPVDDGFTARQQYREGTNILETVFRTEGAFSICTFWLAEALLRCGDRQAAERIFRGMLDRANHLGLYSEEIDPATGEFLGNFPQGFTHIALINCAVAFARKAQSEAPRA